MDMVFWAINQQWFSPEAGDDATHISVEVGFHFGVNNRLAILRAEQGMN
jgi:hypothetical protein